MLVNNTTNKTTNWDRKNSIMVGCYHMHLIKASMHLVIKDLIYKNKT